MSTLRKYRSHVVEASAVGIAVVFADWHSAHAAGCN
eukprot:SAG31_NODE_9093_length_1336_cov_1.227162_2_plen_35_part_01